MGTCFSHKSDPNHHHRTTLSAAAYHRKPLQMQLLPRKSAYSSSSTTTSPLVPSEDSSTRKTSSSSSIRTGSGENGSSASSTQQTINKSANKSSSQASVLLLTCSAHQQGIGTREDSPAIQVLQPTAWYPKRRCLLCVIREDGKLLPTQLYNYPKEDLKEVLSDKDFIEYELSRRVSKTRVRRAETVAQSSSFMKPRKASCSDYNS